MSFSLNSCKTAVVDFFDLSFFVWDFLPSLISDLLELGSCKLHGRVVSQGKTKRIKIKQSITDCKDGLNCLDYCSEIFRFESLDPILGTWKSMENEESKLGEFLK